MGAEETIVRNLVEPFSVEFHATACGGLRACEAACDTESFQISEAGDGEECRKRCAALGKFIAGVSREFCVSATEHSQVV